VPSAGRGDRLPIGFSFGRDQWFTGNSAVLGSFVVLEGVAKEARTRSFASPALAGFALVGVTTSTVCRLRHGCLWGNTRCDVGENLTHSRTN
jgi:hypothetical protein